MSPGVLVLNTAKDLWLTGCSLILLILLFFFFFLFCLVFVSLQPFLDTPKPLKLKFILPWLLAEYEVLSVAGEQRAWQWSGLFLQVSVSTGLAHCSVMASG